MRHALRLGSIVVCLVAGCAGDGESFPVGVVVKAVNYSVPPRPVAPLLIATNTNNGSPDGVPSSGILSGPPSGMRIYLQSIELFGDSKTEIYSSSEPHTTDSGIAVTGCQLSLATGNLDLSVCPGLDSLDIPGGSFTRMAMTFAGVAEISGCINGQFSQVTTPVATAGTFTYPPPFPQTAFAYTTDAVTQSTQYTFCTRQDKHYYLAETASATPIGSNADYDSTNPYFGNLSTPEFVTIDLVTANVQALTVAQLEARSLSINSNTVPTIESPTLTLAVDMNRILGFFANVRSDFKPPAPAGPSHTGTSYFFTTRMAPTGGPTATSAVTAYAGDVNAQGYQWTATSTAGGPPLVAGWYTLFLDGSGNYVSGTMYQDDDAGLTVLNGDTTITSGALETGATLDAYGTGTCAGFRTTALNGSGTCSATAFGSTYNVAYTRLL